MSAAFQLLGLGHLRGWRDAAGMAGCRGDGGMPRGMRFPVGRLWRAGVLRSVLLAAFQDPLSRLGGEVKP